MYKVKLKTGFNASGRQRAGVSLEKGIEQTLELTEEQLKALRADQWIEVSEASDDEAAQAGATGDDEEEPGEFDGLKQADLKAIAEKEEVDITGIRSNAGIIEAIEAARAEGGDDEDESDEEEDEDEVIEVDPATEVTEETPMDQLQAIATALKIEGTSDMNAPSLVKAIKDAQAK